MNGESVKEAARRETKEEAGIDVDDLEKVGMIDFRFEGDPQILEVHVFRSTLFLGDPVETEEMSPQWFDADKIPFECMWPDDRYWFPFFLAGKKFKATFDFRGHDMIIGHELSEWDGA